MISTKVHRGKNSTFVITPKVVEVARKYYACKNMDGMQLEDGGNDDVRDSHWKRLFVKDDLMAAVVGASYYSALTLAFFHDTGFYRVKWAMAERMRWGNGTGCGLMNGKCMKNNITMFLDMFCNESVSTKLHCTYERQAIGRCALNTYGAPLDPDKQYFTRSWIGGNQDNLMDYCPIVEPYKDSYCEDGRQQLLPGSRVGPNSRCVKGDRLVAFSREVGDVCAEVYCGRDAVSIRYSGDDSWHVCPEGEYITPTKTFSSGRIMCPKREEVCYNTDMSPPFDPHASVALLFLLTSSRRII
ncbi:unnamed protein product [Trypanosoma congolense IL3000]|uniref:Leishmanolysin-like peptidase n=1 Tax=Trypanosoma congolense (strain IL3000) TaxID=1068625 RepID=F9WJZ4_TRYCI|nr:unnamed protein product [Trypanosoma congolense IL3000]